MCHKCENDSEYKKEFQHTRYCDDWWEDTSHGGRAGDIEHDQNSQKREKENEQVRNNEFF